MRKPLLGRLLFCIFRPLIKIKVMKKFIYKHRVLWISIIISALLIISMDSCRTGYGCRGNQSWSKMVRRINRP